jgi:hypothetical protein
VAKRTTEGALRGEYIQLAEFLPCPDQHLPSQQLEATVSLDGGIVFKQKQSKKAIDSFSSWLTAFTNFEEIIARAKPELYCQLIAYRRFIQQSDEKYNWSAVRAYDCRFRAHLGKTHSFDYHIVNMQLFSEVFDVISLKATRKCFRCEALDHIASNCPFREGNPLEEKKTDKETEICNKFNEGKCYFSSCRRIHVCRQCQGPSPHVSCPCNQGNRAAYNQPPNPSASSWQPRGPNAN